MVEPLLFTIGKFTGRRFRYLAVVSETAGADKKSNCRPDRVRVPQLMSAVVLAVFSLVFLTGWIEIRYCVGDLLCTLQVRGVRKALCYFGGGASNTHRMAPI